MTTAHVLTGSKTQIAERLVALPGDVHEVIAFVDEPQRVAQEPVVAGDIFAEMSQHMTNVTVIDDSRDAVYAKTDGE